jgi:hypothetical protein
MPDKFVLILDSSQIDAFLQCPTIWYYGYKRRLQPHGAKENVPMDMGTYGHKLLEIIYKERARGNGKNAIDAAFSYDVDQETCRCSHGRERHGCIGVETECLSIGCPCQNFEPQPFPLSLPDREFVKNRVLEYTFVEGASIPELVPTSPDHVEVGFSEKLYEDDDRLYILEGRIDLLGRVANNCEEGWADHKFQSRASVLYTKSIQFRNYAMVTKRSIGIINYIRFAKKIEKDFTFKREILSFSRLEMEAWRRNLILRYKEFEEIIKADDWYNEEDRFRRRNSCSGKFGYPCDFTPLCENFMLPQLIKINEQSDFKQKAEWRPW